MCVNDLWLQSASLVDLYGGQRHLQEMRERSEPPTWESISTAPYDSDLELAVIEQNRVHPLVFACRRTASGWVKVATRERVVVSPTHWRPWSGDWRGDR